MAFQNRWIGVLQHYLLYIGAVCLHIHHLVTQGGGASDQPAAKP